MKLLIVDDQLATLNGISQEIDWAGEGFTQVAAARNAMEARLSFKDRVPEVMICDIEMPVENGIELCRWVRRMNYPTKVIFLTCHSEFAYAKEAIELKAVDYILQPAPYEAIIQVVKKAVQDVQESLRRQEALDKSRAYARKFDYIRKNLWRDYLLEVISRETLLETVERFHGEQMIALVLLQLVCWQKERERLPDAILTPILANFMTDLFPADHYHVVLAPMDSDIYALLVGDVNGADLPAAGLNEPLKLLGNVFDLYMPCAPACYVAESTVMNGLPAVWKQLIKRKDSNVTETSGLFTADSSASVREWKFLDQIRQWSGYLCIGQGKMMEQEAAGLLNRLAAGGDLDSQNLMHFYQDFMQMLYRTGLETNGRPVAQLFASEAEMELYRGGMTSLQQMLALIHHVAVQYTGVQQPDDQLETVEQIKRYIDNHLNQNITRDEISRMICLNPDYATRLFKKETGMSIKSYIIQQKMLAARNLLQDTTLSISHIAVRLGYNNFSHFSMSYKKQFGISPMDEKRTLE